ncbi:MAG: PDZ domain-containing protein [Anaerolineae bacterium]|nr:PDZ domain-containing protein [Anaerolineae bacterium]
MNEKKNGWVWSTLVLAVILLMLLACLCGAVIGGAVAYRLGERILHRQQMPLGPQWEPVPQPWEEIPEWIPEPDLHPWEEESDLPWLGVYFQMIEAGAEIMDVVDDSPAQDAGLEAGDLITHVDDQRVHEDLPLDILIGQYAPGDRIEITFQRDGDERMLHVRLGARPLVLPPVWEDEEFPFFEPPAMGG